MNTWYPEYDFIGVFSPDPPWFNAPKANDDFLMSNFIPMRDEKKCPYCKKSIETVSLGIRVWPSRMQEFVKWMNARPDECDATLHKCTSCGWWAVDQITTGSYENVEATYGSLIDLISVNWAKIKKFDNSHSKAPLKQLQDYLSKKSGWPFLTSTRKLTEVISSCFNHQLPCEVVHIGGSKIDASEIFLVNSDHPVLVRVDQRNRVAELIREILGFEMIDGRYTAMRICTEKRWTDENMVLPVLKNNGFSVSLNNYDAVLETLNRNSERPSEPWENIWRARIA